MRIATEFESRIAETPAPAICPECGGNGYDIAWARNCIANHMNRVPLLTSHCNQGGKIIGKWVEIGADGKVTGILYRSEDPQPKPVYKRFGLFGQFRKLVGWL